MNAQSTTLAQDPLDTLSDFLKTQDYVGDVSIEAVRAARSRDDLGITSLDVIMLVINYLEARGLSGTNFNPDWIPRLDEVPSIASIFREIDLESAKHEDK